MAQLWDSALNTNTAAVPNISTLQHQGKEAAIRFLAHPRDHAFYVPRTPVTLNVRFSPHSLTRKISRVSQKQSLALDGSLLSLHSSSQTLRLPSAPHSGAQLQAQQILWPGPHPALSSTLPQLSSETQPLGTGTFKHVPCSPIAHSYHTPAALPRGKEALVPNTSCKAPESTRTPPLGLP